jgi:hypothetical protein
VISLRNGTGNFPAGTGNSFRITGNAWLVTGILRLGRRQVQIPGTKPQRIDNPCRDIILRLARQKNQDTIRCTPEGYEGVADELVDLSLFALGALRQKCEVIVQEISCLPHRHGFERGKATIGGVLFRQKPDNPAASVVDYCAGVLISPGF